MSGRGSTRPGRPAILPFGPYEPRPTLGPLPAQLLVEFVGEDGRACRFDVGALPLPQWHESLAESWVRRIGPIGPLRTEASARGAWNSVRRFMWALHWSSNPPRRPGDLSVKHVDFYRRQRERTSSRRLVNLELRTVALLFETKPLRDLVPAEVRDHMRPVQRGGGTPKSGYSDAELRRIVRAARADVAALRDRLRQPEEPGVEGHALTQLRATGRTPETLPATSRQGLAERVFATRRDLVAMLVLLVATTGWNVEVIKELPTEHRILEGLAVELQVVKRRRGAGRWHQTVTWEIGPPGRELHTPGGVYLLLHDLMSAGRALVPTQTYWAMWHPHRRHRSAGEGCSNPFDISLSANTSNSEWVHRHQLTSDGPDPDPSRGSAHGELPQALGLEFNRLKTSIDVRRTRQLGGHLPSAARTNTTPVLFRNYLAGDQTTIEWAQELVADVFTDVTASAWSAHKRALKSGDPTVQINGGAPTDPADALKTAGPHIRIAEASPVPASETAWSSCLDHEHHPLTGRRCKTSFLDCFQCSNCLVTGAHLPRLLGLLDALESRRALMTEAGWWARYGSTWTALRHEVIPKFSPAEVDQAQALKPADSLLDLVEPSWEGP